MFCSVTEDTGPLQDALVSSPHALPQPCCSANPGQGLTFVLNAEEPRSSSFWEIRARDWSKGGRGCVSHHGFNDTEKAGQ